MPAPRQSGAALLILLLALALGGLTWLLQQPASRSSAFPARDRATDRALAQAKEALLGYGAAYPEYHLKGSPPRAAFVPGHLPCPDTGSPLGHEGTEAGSCGAKGVTVVGHFPWRSLGIPPPRDGSGECLWYAVSGNYKANPKADLLNPDIPGQFQILGPDGSQIIAGAQPGERPVAVLFAPGPPLAGQVRQHQGGECRLDYDPKQFLDVLQGIDNSTPDSSAEGLTRLIAGTPGEFFNDRLVWISPSELFEGRIARRPPLPRPLFDASYPGSGIALTQRLAACLIRFGEHNSWQRLPWAAPLSLNAPAPDTFRNDKLADQALRQEGRPPFSVGRSQQVLQSTLGTLPGCLPADPTHSACRLLRSDNCPELLAAAGYPTPSDGAGYVNSSDGWWDKWKDHLFYLVAPGFAPAALPAVDCDLNPEQCLQVNGQPYAAALIYAGAPLAGQQRHQSSERMDPANYLEGQNATTLQLGGQQLELAGNDQIVCIQGPTAAAPGFKLVSNCGNLNCQAEADKLLARVSGQQNLCQNGPDIAPTCQMARQQLAGCACRGAADAFLAQPCLGSLNPAACQAAILALKGCA